MKEQSLFCCLFLFVSIHGLTDDTSLWDQIIRQEQVAVSVIYHGRLLNVWRQDSHGYSRFYVTPLCVIDLNSISCITDEYSSDSRYIFAFDIKLWDFDVAKAVKQALKQRGIHAKMYDIFPLPMQQIRIGLENRNLEIQADNHWRSNQDQPRIIPFELYINNEMFCNKMMNDIKKSTDRFLRILKPFFEFTMVVGQTASRNFNITGKMLQKSSFYSNLMNKYAGSNGIVYLQSKDANKLAHEIFNKVAYAEEVSGDYIPSNQEKDIINELLNIFKQEKLHSNELSKEQWDTVFWDDIFARPDVQTEYFNHVLKYDATENNFKFDEQKEKEFRSRVEKKHSDAKNYSGGGGFSFGGFGINASGATGNSKTDETKNEEERKDKNVLKFDDLQKAISNNKVNVKWSGEKFEPKNLDLYRLNVKELNSANEIYFKRVTVKKYQSTQKIEIKAETYNSTSLLDKLYDEEDTSTTKTSTTKTSTTKITTTKNSKINPCSEGWTFYEFTGYCYQVFGKNGWNGANEACKAENANLASVHEHEEMHFIKKLALDYPGYGSVLIGLKREDDGIWKWSDGTTLDYVNWVENEGNLPEDNCVVIHLSDRSSEHFYRLTCNVTTKYVCKKLPP